MGSEIDYNDVGVIVLAAGKGTRMKSDIAKVLHRVANKSMVVHVVKCAKKIARDNVIVVVSHQAQKVKDEVSKFFKVDYAVQEELLGTGDAVKVAIPGLKPSIKNVLVLCGDVPLIQESTLLYLMDGHKQNQAKASVLATDVDDPTGYGRIVLDQQNNMLCIKEEADATENEKKIKKVNAGIYCFDKKFLISVIDEIKPDNNQKEYYLTDVVEIARKRHEKIVVITMDDPRQVIGVNTLEELGKVECLVQQFGK
ncbi:sugar phosphate nucleotidyltransferase [Desulfobacula sp.]|uniref:sugar phosphate nucleotidyltransferase n=1 Tax=Desulfobacula sp. TaxID=2593537 RepID=UPI0025B88C08|nr:sugar phosphate nucleotidyltransferase [Desulfobacula sp.]MBC2705908.1 NTP transferase domain-containing protein [Desulfobacula sp.]